jgi:protein subunit release factor B
MPKELLFSVTKKDLEIDFFSGTGAGGQYRNKHQNCVRIRHKDSGAFATGQSNRERPANIQEAFRNLLEHPKFKIWQSQKILECVSGETTAQRVEKALAPENLKVEGKDGNGRCEEL